MDEAPDYGASQEAVQKATGKSWQQWFDILDKEVGRDMPHRDIVKWLASEYDDILSSWWAQTVTVGYEYFIDRRIIGQTADTGWQLGIQRTIEVGLPQLWDYLLSPQGLEKWLGKVEDFKLKKGEKFKLMDGGVGEVRSVKEHERIRLTFTPSDRDAPVTMQLYLANPSSNRDKTSLLFHFEKLASQQERQEFKQKYEKIFEAIKKSVAT